MTGKDAAKIVQSLYESHFMDDFKLEIRDPVMLKIDAAIKKAVELLENEPEDKGEISDGYHTFNQLYHQRAVLFAALVNQNPSISWKSYKHEDGHYCFDKDGEWFIVGIDTPQGSYTYHYLKEYWDLFKCEELPVGKHWDGHTEEDVTRLLSLVPEFCEDAVNREELLKMQYRIDDSATLSTRDVVNVEDIEDLPNVQPKIKTAHWVNNTVSNIKETSILEVQSCKCDNCGKYHTTPYLYYFNEFKFCPNCGARMLSE